MTTILPFVWKDPRRGVFEPELTHGMSLAFDEVCERLAIPATAHAAREVIALRIIGLARDGEHDPEGMRDAVLKIIGVPARATGL
jgi:hypothetical protein